MLSSGIDRTLEGRKEGRTFTFEGPACPSMSLIRAVKRSVPAVHRSVIEGRLSFVALSAFPLPGHVLLAPALTLLFFHLCRPPHMLRMLSFQIIEN